MLTKHGYTLEDGGIIEWPEDDSKTIRRLDKDGNTQEVRLHTDPDYIEWANLFRKHQTHFNKTTYGFVVQTFNNAGECIRQEFICGDEIDYDNGGDPINSMDMPLGGNEYFPFSMVQPEVA